MNCSIFRKKLEDYMEGCISYDLKTAMDKHLDNCESCKDLYFTELYIDRVFKDGLDCEKVEFNSIAEDVMKSIDKKQYAKASSSKVYHSFTKHTVRYASLAAVLILCIAMAPLLINNRTKTDYLSKTSAEAAKKGGEDNGSYDIVMTPASPGGTQKNEFKPQSANNAVMKNTIDQYKPQVLKKSVVSQPSSNTPWKESPSKTYTACIEGIGEKAQEQGMSKIIVNNLAANEMWSYELTEASNTRLNTPKNLEWWDDENLLVVLSFSQGHISSGDLYVLNIKTLEIKPVYDIPNKLNKIASVVKSGEKLILDMEVYDENLNKYYAEKWTLKGFGIKSKEIKVIGSNGEIVDTISTNY